MLLEFSTGSKADSEEGSLPPAVDYDFERYHESAAVLEKKATVVDVAIGKVGETRLFWGACWT